MNDFRSLLDGTLWLMEPVRLRQYATQLLRATAWPSARAVAKERKKRLDEARGKLPLLPGTGLDDPSERQLTAKAVRAQKGGVGVIPIHGPIEQRLSCAGMFLGGTSCEEISACLDSLLNDKSCDAIIFHCDSPGGSSYGIEELGDKIYSARGKKNLYAIADSMACSACYWLATAAEHLSCTPGGDVGSVGAYAMHCDESAALEMAGLKITTASAGKYKTEFHPHAPLSPEAIAELQKQTDWSGDKFQDAVKRNRNTTSDDVRRNYGQGRAVNADDALSRKMVDRLMTFEQLLTKLTGSGEGGSKARAASMEVLRLRQAQRVRMASLLTGVIEPEPGESEDEFMDRCQESGKSETECERIWDEKGEMRAALATPGRRLAPGLTHDSKTTMREPQWSSVDKTKLPDNAFADDEDRKFPHHYVQGGGKPDEEGHYTTGDLWLHKGGLNAAWSAAQGGRSGEKASEEVIAHLQRHRRALGLEE
jgi:ClpP class serine protease